MPHAISPLSELFIWPHAGCNHRCVSCDIWRDTSRRELAADDVARWSDEWVRLGVRNVILTGGEPLMHSDLFSLAAPLRERGMAIMLLSTGPLLKKYAAQVVEHFDVVLVSLDGPPAIHDEIRRTPRAHHLLERGIAAVRAVKPDLRVFARCTVHRFNFRHLPETVRAAQQLHIDRISFIPADVTSEAFNRAGGWDVDRQEDLVVPADALPTLADELDRLVADCADSFASGLIQESPEHLRRYLYGYYRAFHGRADYPAVTCSRPFESAVVEVDGTVRPCFFLEPYGNVHKAGGLDAVVNSPAAMRWRDELDVASNEICKRCVCFKAVESPLPGQVWYDER